LKNIEDYRLKNEGPSGEDKEKDCKNKHKKSLKNARIFKKPNIFFKPIPMLFY